MSVAKLAFRAALLFAASLSLSEFSPNNAALAAESCIAAPNGPAPQGSHWYYRTERPSLRKCWRLVQKDGQSVAASTAPQSGPEKETEASPTQAAIRPADSTPKPEGNTVQTPIIRNLVTRNVSNIDDAGPPPLPPDPPADTMPRAEKPNAPAPIGQTSTAEQALAAIVERPAAQPLAAAAPDVSEASGAPTWRTVLGAVALLAFLVCGVFLVMQLARRRADVLNSPLEADELPVETSPEVMPRVDGPTFAPLPPMAVVPGEDDIVEAMRRFTQDARRRAA